MNDRDSLLPNLWFHYKGGSFPTVRKRDDQHVSFTICFNHITFGFSAIYTSTNYITRRNLCKNFTPSIPDTPWCFIKDFNAIIEANEYHGDHCPTKIPMENFYSWSNSDKFIHLHTKGNHFTWSNGRSGKAFTEKD